MYPVSPTLLRCLPYCDGRCSACWSTKKQSLRGNNACILLPWTQPLEAKEPCPK
ncbi:hypothetical protein COCCADRAFT_84491 [Bipolaris zeicola 26-R-13]|uniref:Uncharacterized protein n=1 Tax=Cochliobolus carbonum (strain 26-R-13) TaxID=930089 RepID=W6YR32_COCC2|nr:uncharacterized protein COCCADRAFT_84491 [Bipolaris zeicola 26-R-13]EUC37879.1 hypothetical protein COCCADRAFT_84491 [Bipolaris zeicola 26-R-13]